MVAEYETNQRGTRVRIVRVACGAEHIALRNAPDTLAVFTELFDAYRDPRIVPPPLSLQLPHTTLYSAMPIAPPAFLSPVPLPAIGPRIRRRTRLPSTPCASAAAPPDDDFFLPLDDVSLLRGSRVRGEDAAAPGPQRGSVVGHRTEEKRRELTRSAIKTLHDDDELLRTQLAGEELSAEDLMGSVDTAGIDLGGVEEGQGEGVAGEKSRTDASRRRVNEKAGVAAEGKTEAVRKRGAVTRGRGRAAQSGSHSVRNGAAATGADSQRSGGGGEGNGMVRTAAPLPRTKATLQQGDLVLHVRHGVGRFRGIERTVASSLAGGAGEVRPIQEFAVIEYRDGDVYVPFLQFEAVRRLSAEERKSVERLDAVAGSADYPGKVQSTRSRRSRYTARARTRQKIRTQLVNLHGLYAERTTIERDPFEVDEEAEQQFADGCSFELTADQKVATTQVLEDMSSSRRPMDRLLCGDVGFGKTEVAIRASFRALHAGKQVAILAPTTILAQQHFETFSERFAEAYPAYTIACMTRFVPRKLTLEAREKVKTGEVRIAIGTHMLLSDKCVFSNLGLLIVDEEHRFGVNQKEKIRARYRGIDSLFLSATPIPRTLHLALSGLRDASVLRTPPVGRKPVITRVSPSGAGVVREAIGIEVKRQGQVFFVVPRIEGIEATANWVRDLFPTLRVLVAHGSISDLERRIWEFAQREYDVLVCTTIIENGINMPNVNTIIIQDAGKFGLAQLHQLRGRVGRSDTQAYAWMLHSHSHGSRSMQALDRLKALEKYSELGSGFAIAQRDMEMRGVGTILGVEQHGNTSVGADEYAKMLSEELEHARTGEPIPISFPDPSPTIEVFLPVASMIPSEYINDFEEKMTAYALLSDAPSYEELAKVVDDLESRFGSLPSATRRHVSLLELKLFAKPLGIGRIAQERQHVVLDWPVEERAFRRLVAFLPDEQSRSRCELRIAEERVVVRGLGICSGDVQLAKLRQFLGFFSKAASGLVREKDRRQADPSSLVSTLSKIGDESV